ncbi:MAG: hypothetical protein EOP84_01695 [Verrucomicrobiaceae bacterium]|nr:MAG: hypothetical protein EOP84_01695 [Verrucomicrobiaceae bacterium]
MGFEAIKTIIQSREYEAQQEALKKQKEIEAEQQRIRAKAISNALDAFDALAALYTDDFIVDCYRERKYISGNNLRLKITEKFANPIMDTLEFLNASRRNNPLTPKQFVENYESEFSRMTKRIEAAGHTWSIDLKTNGLSFFNMFAKI